MRFPVFFTPLLTRAAFFVMSFVVACSASNAENLSRILAEFPLTSPMLADARLALAETRADYTSNRALPNPYLVGEQERWDDNSIPTETTIGIRQNFGFLWTQSSRVHAARLAYESELATFEELQNELAAQLVVAAYEYDGFRRQSIVLDSVLNRARELTDAMAARRELGDVSLYDEQRLQIELVQLQHRRQQLFAEEQRTLTELIRLTGLSERQLEAIHIDIEIHPSEMSMEEASSYALEHRPRAVAAAREMESADWSHRAARLSQLPDFSIGFGLKSQESGQDGSVIDAELEIPIFGQRRSQRRIAAAAQGRAGVHFLSERQLVEQEIRTAYKQWNHLQTIDVPMSIRMVEGAQLNMERGVLLYLEGELSIFELVDALHTGIEAQETAFELRNALIAAQVELRRSVGLEILE